MSIHVNYIDHIVINTYKISGEIHVQVFLGGEEAFLSIEEAELLRERLRKAIDLARSGVHTYPDLKSIR